MSKVSPLRRNEPPKEGIGTWFWIFLVGGILVLSVVAAMKARAGTVDITYDPPADPDLLECRFFLQNATGGVIDNQTVLVGMLGPGNGVRFNYDTVSLQGTEGKVVARCVDAAGQVSVDSTPLAALFPDVAPGAPRVTRVQVTP